MYGASTGTINLILSLHVSRCRLHAWGEDLKEAFEQVNKCMLFSENKMIAYFGIGMCGRTFIDSVDFHPSQINIDVYISFLISVAWQCLVT